MNTDSGVRLLDLQRPIIHLEGRLGEETFERLMRSLNRQTDEAALSELRNLVAVFEYMRGIQEERDDVSKGVLAALASSMTFFNLCCPFNWVGIPTSRYPIFRLERKGICSIRSIQKP